MSASASNDEINREKVPARVRAAGPWFHSIDLGNGLTTPGSASKEFLTKCADIYFAMGIKDLSILDVGAWDGFSSFEAERRGASRVLAVDKYCWGGGGPGNREAFELAREIIGSRVEDRILDISETRVEVVGEFDLVLFNGIIYHIFNPLSALQEMAKIARYGLTVETFMDNIENPRPVMVFYPGEVRLQGPQNGWGVNSYCMHAVLKVLGFETVLEFQTPHPKMPNRSIFIALKPGHPFKLYVERHISNAQPRLTPGAACPIRSWWRRMRRSELLARKLPGAGRFETWRRINDPRE
jgi:tRNA (mo5U34)-methyltransferase